jgi:hypothetical protein
MSVFGIPREGSLAEEMANRSSLPLIFAKTTAARRPAWRNLPRSLRQLSIGWIAVAAALGCSGSDGTGATQGGDGVAESPNESSLAETIYGGIRDNDDEAMKSVVAIKVGNGAVFELCTGALIGKNMILTARHCLSKNVTSTVVCDEQGKSGNGDHVSDDVPIDSVSVYTGANPTFSQKANALAKQIVHADGSVLCNKDIAVLIVDRDLDLPLAPIRVGKGISAGENIRSVGYGKNDAKLPTGTRIRRDAVSVLAVGKAVSASKTPLGSHEFEVGISTCQGDSGGPAISEDTGAVIGVVSRGGECTDDFGHIYTSTGGEAALLQQAFDIAGGSPVLEEGSSMTVTADDGTPQRTYEAPKSSSCASAPGFGGTGFGGALMAIGLAAVARRRRDRTRT